MSHCLTRLGVLGSCLALFGPACTTQRSELRAEAAGFAARASDNGHSDGNPTHEQRSERWGATAGVRWAESQGNILSMRLGGLRGHRGPRRDFGFGASTPAPSYWMTRLGGGLGRQGRQLRVELGLDSFWTGHGGHAFRGWLTTAVGLPDVERLWLELWLGGADPLLVAEWAAVGLGFRGGSLLARVRMSAHGHLHEVTYSGCYGSDDCRGPERTAETSLRGLGAVFDVELGAGTTRLWFSGLASVDPAVRLGVRWVFVSAPAPGWPD